MGSWNPTGKEFCPIPNPDFAQFKLQQFWTNMRSSSVAGMLLQGANNYIFMNHSLEQIIKEDCVDMSVAIGWQVPLL